MNTNQIYCGDVLDLLKQLEPESVDCCITSPPYWGLRDYGTAKWEGGNPKCDHNVGRFEYIVNEKQNSNKGSAGHHARNICPECGAKRIDKQIGLEESPEEYVAKMVEVFREVKRVLKKEGTLWLNLGDSYWGGGFGTSPGGGDFLKPKNLCGIPWRVAFALQADGWYLRQDIIWQKPNPMPESVTDRCTKAHEYVFLMAKAKEYYFDAEAIKEPAAYDGRKDTLMKGSIKYKESVVPNQAEHTMAARGHERWLTDSNGNYIRNKRSVWTVSKVTTKPFKGAHFATFPPDLIKPMVLAGCPLGGTILDPFMGAGTTAVVAKENGRKYIGFDLNPAYVEMANKRVAEAKYQMKLGIAQLLYEKLGAGEGEK